MVYVIISHEIEPILQEIRYFYFLQNSAAINRKEHLHEIRDLVLFILFSVTLVRFV